MSQCYYYCLLLFSPVTAIAIAAIATSNHDIHASRQGSSTILVSSVGRPRFSFEIYVARNSTIASADGDPDRRLTSGSSVNYNGQFVAASENEWIKFASGGSVCAKELSSCKILAYVSEDEEGSPQVFFKEFKVTQDGQIHEGPGSPWKLHDINHPASIDQQSSSCNSQYYPFFQDRPSVANGRIIYVGMRKNCRLRQSWAAIFSKDLKPAPGGKVDQPRCLTPKDVADFSPSVSPSGKWVIVASDQNHGFRGELCSINSDLYIFRAADGSERHLLIKNAGWPSWGATDSKFFFHRLAADGWWSVYEASITWSCGAPIAMEQKRLTKSGFHAFTPAASRDGKWVALATRRPLDHEIKYRHVEILDLASGEMRILSSSTLKKHQYNPFIDPDDSTRIGYHRCGTEREGRNELEALRSPVENVSIHRIAGDFASFSTDGSFIAFNVDINSRKKGERGVCVMHRDGSNKTRIFEPKNGRAFGTSWGKDLVVYSSYGEDVFMSGNATTHIVAIYLNVIVVDNAPRLMEEHRVVRLTKDQLEGNSLYNNNAFPSASPDGKWIIFRSSRASDEQMGKTYYNLYVMDSQKGEFKGAKAVRLTSGKWTDTMCVWSPNGEWIAFASDREEPGSRKYAVYKMRWDEAKVKEVMQSAEQESAILQVTKVTNNEGSALHPHFSPDSKRLVFATDYAGLSAEPISAPNMFQPYGEVYICELNDCATTLHRMTWSPYETSLPMWGHGSISPNAHSLFFSKGCSKGPCDFSDGLSLGGEDRMAQFCDMDNIVSRRIPSFKPEALDKLETPESTLCNREQYQ